MDRQLDFLELEDRAKQAESLLGHAIFGESVRKLRNDYLSQIEAVRFGDGAALLIAHARLKVLTDVVSSLQSVVSDYKIALKRQKDKAA